MRIGWDIDGVGFVFGDSLHNHMKHTGHGHLWKSGPTPEPYWHFYKDWGWTDQQFVEFCNEAADCGCLFTGPVRKGYAEGIRAVHDLGHENIFITDRSFGSSPEVSELLTYAWFEMHDIKYDELHFSRNKTVVPTDMFIDDKLENYDALDLAGTDVYLLTRPWNLRADHRRRVNSVRDYVTKVRLQTMVDVLL